MEDYSQPVNMPLCTTNQLNPLPIDAVYVKADIVQEGQTIQCEDFYTGDVNGYNFNGRAVAIREAFKRASESVTDLYARLSLRSCRTWNGIERSA